MSATIGDVVAVLEQAYPPALAESWDAVGLVCGDRRTPVERVVVAVDPVAATVDETLEVGAQLLVCHHPLLLRGVHGVPADDHKGNLVHRLIRADAGLFCAHTNADSADPGVSDALADALGLTVVEPLERRPGEQLDPSACTGLGRICELPAAESFAAFTERVAAGLPATAWGVRAGGDPQREIGRVAVCGGAGDSQLATVAARGVDAYVTADLRHHPALEALSAGGPALVDVAHWASEWPWCVQAASVIRDGLRGTVDVLVSHRRTDPWTLGCPGPGASAATGRSAT